MIFFPWISRLKYSSTRKAITKLEIKNANKKFESFENPYNAPSKAPIIIASQNRENAAIAIAAIPNVTGHGKKTTLKNKTMKDTILKISILI